MQTLPPIQMPGKSKDAPSAGVKLATHALAVFLGAAGGVGGSIATQQPSKPEPPEAVQPKQAQPKEVPMPDYEARLRYAFAQERASLQTEVGPNLRKLIFIYRAAISAIEMGEMKTFPELSRAFKEQESAMGLTARLPLLRAVVTAEWNDQIGAMSGPITPGMRVDISVFMRQTVSWLERLPK